MRPVPETQLLGSVKSGLATISWYADLPGSLMSHTVAGQLAPKLNGKCLKMDMRRVSGAAVCGEVISVSVMSLHADAPVHRLPCISAKQALGFCSTCCSCPFPRSQMHAV